MKYLILSLMAVTSAACSQIREGGVLSFDEKVSMDDALDYAQTKGRSYKGATIGAAPVVRPAVERPSYVPEKEMALVTPPKTMLVWTFPHVTDDNVRQFGHWKTIFLNDRYEWVKPTHELSSEESRTGGMYGTLPR